MQKATSQRDRERIGILGGSFNPIHNGHLLAARVFFEAMKLDRVFLVPSARPPHKEAGVLAAERHRYIMTRMAASKEKCFEVSSIELDRPGLSFTVDTISHFQEIYPSAELHFLMGGDALQLITTWKEPEKIVAMCTSIVIVNRPGCLPDMYQSVLADFDSEFSTKILFISIPGMEISSTDIRQRIRENRSISYMVPSAVEQYIIKSELYKE